ncbi:tetratricopeptide repeat protein [Algoriphagus zhangzhouensis]|uniref:Sensor histidine kinase, LytS/YehU family n=1 Tax=Algoriphagus zhangzhouensis TaxID=1073327 RepID=A0A1M7ZHN0_9BACT|nr:tetratricopeptide repeat protein [Algoriphagus zhangzhouensis]TDY44174.1 tetratricopeptide repeat protein [Algoriphagus zhangzhouensis]SHO64332.1 Sensor histidine kinase, LytS/YehU family [Algoriphagus zhangzhouensis]
MRFTFRTVLTFLLFSLIWTNTIAQTQTIDSLKTELEIHTNKDSTRVNLLNALAFSFFSRDIPKSLEYLNESEELADAIGFKKGKARSIYIKGITEAIQSNYDQALQNYDQALKLYESINFKKGIANSYNAMGITFRNKGELRNAIANFKKAISIEEEIGSDNLSASLLNLGTAYEGLGEFEEAISYLNKALSIAESNQNEQRVSYSLNNLGNIYMQLGNYPLAQEHFKKSLYMNEKLADSISMAHNLGNIAMIYKVQKDYEKAMETFDRSLGIYERINSKQGVSNTLNGIGTIYEELDDLTKALEKYFDALEISKQIEADSEIPSILNNIGGIYLKLNTLDKAKSYFSQSEKISLEIENKETLSGAYIGQSRVLAKQTEYNKALSKALKAYEISENSGFLNYQKEASELLSLIYEATGDFKKALQNHKQYKILDDSLFNKENIEKIAQLEYEYKYKLELDSANIRELKLTKTVLDTSQDLAKTRQNYLWAIIGILLISIALGTLIFIEKLKNEKSKTKHVIVEQKLLRSQMTPHFIFNSLSVLQGMILNKEESKSVNYLSKFSRLLRIILENSRDKLVLLSREITAVENYLSLLNLEDNKFHFTIHVNEKTDPSQIEIPPMLIQPFVENAIEHAFNGQSEESKIDISLKYEGEQLICTISDNGIGIDSQRGSQSKNKKSLSTAITSERLKILSNDFKMKGDIKIEDRSKYNEKGTIVTLTIPYKLSQES